MTSTPSGATEAWSVDDVYLLTDGRDGRIAVPQLRIGFDQAGLTLTKASDEVVWSSPWVELSGLSTADRSVLPDGREGIVIVIAERNGVRHRFVLPTDDPAEMESRLRTMALAQRLTTNRTPRAAARPLTALVALATVATLVALLLAAHHVIHL
jgi:hypothetical protein